MCRDPEIGREEMSKFITEIGDVVEISADVIARAVEMAGEFDEFRVYSSGRIIDVESTERPRDAFVTVDATGVLDAREIDDAEIVKLSTAWFGDMDCGTGSDYAVTTADDFMRAVVEQINSDLIDYRISPDMPISIIAPGRHVVVARGKVGDFI